MRFLGFKYDSKYVILWSKIYNILYFLAFYTLVLYIFSNILYNY